jgi:iron complex outermembrane recepter protein
MEMKTWHRTLTFGVVIASALPAVTAAADQAGAVVEEVLVTAQRRTESLQDVPISVTVASGDQLEKAGVARLEDIAVIAPAVQLSRTGVYTQPSVRGITTTLAGNYENNVAIYVDGYYLPFTRGLNTDLVNISQLQVLKGPQGTLFGRNATGGAILVQTLDPSLSERSGRLKLTYRDFNDRQVQGYFSTPLGDKFAWNVAGNYREADGYIQDVSGFDTAPIDSYSVSTKLRWQPTEQLDITGKFESMRVSDGRTLASTYEGRSLVVFRVPGTYLETRDNRTSVNFPVENSAEQETGSLKIDYDFGWGALHSITAYQEEEDRLHYDLDGTALRYFEQRTRDKNEAFSQDLNLTSSGDGPIQYVVGAYYFNAELRTVENASLNALTATPTVYVEGQHNTSKTEAFAGYADVTWQAASRLFLTAGLRYSDETKKLNVACPTLSAGCPRDPFVDDEADFDSWTPRGVVRFQLDDDSSVYASYSKGFKSGLISVASPFNVVDPEEVDAYEVGYKTARGTWRLDTAAYYYDYQDLQVSSLQIVNGINTAVTTNAASAEIYGAEAQFSIAPVDDFNISAGAAYTHARYKSFPEASYNAINAAGLNTTSCVNSAPPPAQIPCVQDWSGQQPTRAPDWTGNLAADYTLRTGIGSFELAGNVFYTSSYIPLKGDLDTSGNFRYGNEDYTLVSARISWSPNAFDALTLTAFGENLGDARYYFYRSGNAFGDYHVLGQPRTWGVSADFRF